MDDLPCLSRSSSSEDVAEDAFASNDEAHTPMDVSDHGSEVSSDGERLEGDTPTEEADPFEDEDLVEEMMHTYFPHIDPTPNGSVQGESAYKQRWNQVAAEARQPLYPDASCSRLSYILLLSNLAAKYNVPNVFMDKLFALLSRKCLPASNAAPTTRQEAKLVLSTIGMDYEAIHACPNDCILYKGRYRKRTRCPTCRARRYRKDVQGTKIPVKVRW